MNMLTQMNNFLVIFLFSDIPKVEKNKKTLEASSRFRRMIVEFRKVFKNSNIFMRIFILLMLVFLSHLVLPFIIMYYIIQCIIVYMTLVYSIYVFTFMESETSNLMFKGEAKIE